MSGPAVAGAVDPRRLHVVAPNLHRRFSGVTATIVALVPRQAANVPIAATGPNLPPHVPKVPFWTMLRHGWAPPEGLTHRIWHARRNDEMMVGLFLRHVLRQPWKLIFTSAAQRRHKPLTRWLIHQMDAVIATSPFAARYLEVPAAVIEHGVDTKRFSPPADRAAAWSQTGLPGTRGIGVFGRLRHNKGTDLFVDAMLLTLKDFPDVTAVLTGLEAPEEAGFINALKKRVSDAGMAGRIHFLGERPSGEVPLWFSRVSIYVAPMRWEGFGLTPLEAMASSAAVVATRVGAAPLLVEDGVTGFLIPPNDLDALITAIRALLADPARAEAMGRAGRAKALARHDIMHEAARINAVYRAVLRAGSVPDERPEPRLTRN